MRFLALTPLLCALALGGCAVSGPPADMSSGAPVPQGPVVSLKIPSEQYPPPGLCRLWLPGRMPDDQPDATACYTLQGEVPPGAWVLYRPPREEKLIEVTAYDGTTPKRVIWVRYFEMETGRFVHEILAN